MKKKYNQITIESFILFALLIAVHSSNAQGRFVRGVEKVEYSISGTKADFYVSPSGNDNWTGKLAEPNQQRTDGPFATIERARQAVLDLKKQVYQLKKPAVEKRFKGTPHQFGTGRDILVLIREGVYSLDSALVFNPEDGGERVETDLPTGAFEYHELKDCFVTYAAYPGEKPIISGGTRVTGWSKSGAGKWSAKIDPDEVNDLYANGKRLTLARTPNVGLYSTDGQPGDSAWFRFKGKDLQPWKGLENGRIHMNVRWGTVNGSVRKVDAKNRMAYLRKPSRDIMLVPPRYYIENIEALMDTANEYFYDRSTHILTFIPEKNMVNPNDAQMIIPKITDMIRVKGSRQKPVRNLRLYNLTFNNTGRGGSATLWAQYTRNCEWLGNHIENVGQSGIMLGLGCYHNLVSKNVINDIFGGSGIVIQGAQIPEVWSDMITDNIVTYNKISNIRPSGTGISTFNTNRTTVSHNYVSNTASYGITLGYWPNIEETCDGSYLAEYNHVSFTNMEHDDQGGIAVYGLSPGSVVRNNLIHDVHPAATNENVGFFFQNMSLGWTVTNNIFYNLKQGELKYCAAYPVDNVYNDNFKIESPQVAPEEIITGEPDLKYDQFSIETKNQNLETGKDVTVSARVFNQGSTGTAPVFLYVDGKVAITQLFPSISNNYRIVTFKYKFVEPGEHRVAIGSTREQVVKVTGEPCYFVYQNLKTEMTEIPQGDSLIVSVNVQNLRNEKAKQKIELIDKGKTVVGKELNFEKLETKTVRFAVLPEIGNHSLSVGSLPSMEIRVYPVKKIEIDKANFLTYCSTTAKPGKFNFDAQKNHFEISAAGTDFLHGEDSYGTIFLKGAVEGNFVASVKLVAFSENISEWFRAGIFVRNDLAKSNSSERGSIGSFLMFSTTKRSGAQWDEFANGCMHNSKSKNYTMDNPIPVWLKVIRHGNKFSGYYSFDGKTWTLSRESGDIPGLAAKMDIGLAGGSNDQRVSKVTFEDFQLWVETK